jgi:hypothetical protein
MLPLWTRAPPKKYPALASEKPPTNGAILARLASNAMAVLNFLAETAEASTLVLSLGQFKYPLKKALATLARPVGE